MRSEKQHLVNYIGSLLKDSEYVYFISYSGLKVADMTVLRNKLAEAGAGVHVLKNTLIKKAAELSEISALDGINFSDSTALVCGSGDASVAAKIIMEFGKTCNQVAPKGGYFEGVKGLNGFSDTEIVLLFKKSRVVVRGEQLEIKKYCDGDLQLSGRIFSVGIEKRE